MNKKTKQVSVAQCAEALENHNEALVKGDLSAQVSIIYEMKKILEAQK